MAEGYEIVSIDDLERHAGWRDEDPLLRPLRRHAGFRPFGLNCWEASAVGRHVIEPHSEVGGDEELYVVLRGRATFTVAGETIDAPPGTLVHVPATTPREACGRGRNDRPAAGAKPGSVRAQGWEDFRIAVARHRSELRAIDEVLILERLGGPSTPRAHGARRGPTTRSTIPRALALDPNAQYALEDTDFRIAARDKRWQDAIA